jgi:hypothetical protein
MERYMLDPLVVKNSNFAMRLSLERSTSFIKESWVPSHAWKSQPGYEGWTVN